MVARLSESGAHGDPRLSETLSRAMGILEDRVLGRGHKVAPEAPAEVTAGPADLAAVATELEVAIEEVPAEPEPPPFDPVAATAAVEDAAASGDATATRDLALTASSGHRAAGQLHAAIDVCYLALATSPADAGLHLTLAELYLDLGWRTTAVDKLVLLGRLAELGDDTETRTRLCAIVASRVPDEPALASLCA
jgi:hypothetical protein